MRLGFSSSLLVFLVLTTCTMLYADMFSYTDAQGTMHFVDDPAKIPAKIRKKLLVNQETPSDSLNPELGYLAIDFYSDDACVPCNYAEEYLKARGFRYIKYDPSYNKKDRERLKEKSGDDTIPFFVIGSYKSTGFNISTEREIDSRMNYTPSRQEEEDSLKREKRAMETDGKFYR